MALDPLLAGHNGLILAPTAGGKTEAAMLPLMDNLARKRAQSVAVIYLSPLRALLNNQEARMQILAGLGGGRAFKWHGEVAPGERQRFLDEPAEVLLITPESLEVLLSRPGLDKKALFADLRAVVIDEIHAFAGDDRGDHLMALLAKLQVHLDNDFQRVGLSATVGNPEKLLEWLRGDSERPSEIIDPGRSKARRLVEVRPLDEDDDPGVVAAMLARGQKSLFFTDSRGHSEKLQRSLTEAGIRALTHHGSLSREYRAQTETEFRNGRNCCIVCTSTLELGLDVGDLDLVLQHDAPFSVSAFLQRLGRTGRRPGSRGHLAFLTDKKWSFLRAVALVSLAQEGYVEPVAPSRRAYPVLVQQMLLRVVEAGGLPPTQLWESLGSPYPFQGIDSAERREILENLLELGLLSQVDSCLTLGPEGENRFARSNFLDLYCVFDSASQLKVVTESRAAVGHLEAWFVHNLGGIGSSFHLAGRAWLIREIDWQLRQVAVVPSIGGSSPAWLGPPRLLSFKLCQKILTLLAAEEPVAFLAPVALNLLNELRQEWGPDLEDGPAIKFGSGGARLLTFAGGKVNHLLARYLECYTGEKCHSNNYWLQTHAPEESLAEALSSLKNAADFDPVLEVACQGRSLSKFQEFLPEKYERIYLQERLFDPERALEMATALLKSL